MHQFWAQLRFKAYLWQGPRLLDQASTLVGDFYHMSVMSMTLWYITPRGSCHDEEAYTIPTGCLLETTTLSQFLIASLVISEINIPSGDIPSPKYQSSCTINSHFSGCAYSLHSRILLKRVFKCSACCSRVSEKTKMSSMNTVETVSLKPVVSFSPDRFLSRDPL